MKQASPPLPRDLHVLSLSLAFILSQDQTLRCCLSSFLFFSKSKRADKYSNYLLFRLKALPPDFVRLRLPQFRSVVSLTYSFKEIDSGHSFMTLVLLLVYCNSFNVLRFFRSSFPQKRCKVTATFLFTQIFSNNFSSQKHYFTPAFPLFAMNLNELKLCYKTYF